MENLRNILPKVDGAILVTTPQVINLLADAIFNLFPTFY
jgi:hypothetical protein